MAAGMLYQKLTEGFIDHNAFIVGFAMGIGFGIIELFFMKNVNRHLKPLPFLAFIIAKAIIYTLIIILIYSITGLTAGLVEGKQIEEFYASFLEMGIVYFISFSLFFFAIVFFFLQISRLLGEGILLKFLFGKYYKPVEEDRIFMFLDIKSSTTLAEKLGLTQYYSLLNTFFYEITEPVLMKRAEIYQYVGDEIVFTWKTEECLKDANCVELFFSIKDHVEKNRDHYLEKYNVVPQFKAGLHFGNVIT